MNTKKLSTDIRQKQIYDAAIDIIKNQGLSKLTILGIADKVGVTKSNVYRHYSSKDLIVEGIISELNSDLANILKHSNTLPNSISKLKYIFVNHIELLVECSGVPVLIFTDQNYKNNQNIKKLISKTMLMYKNSIVEIIETGNANGELSIINSNSAFKVFLSLIQGTILQWTIGGANFDIKKHTDSIWNFFKTSISNTEV